jgi:hypothetical protein
VRVDHRYDGRAGRHDPNRDVLLTGIRTHRDDREFTAAFAVHPDAERMLALRLEPQRESSALVGLRGIIVARV